MPDERARLRAAGRAARGRRATSPRRRRATGGRRRRLQHLRGARERRQQALRQPRPPRAGQGRATRACRSPSAAAWRRRTATPSSRKAPWVDVVFGTHNIGSLPVLLERARVTTARRRSRSSSRSRSSRPRCRPGASRPTPPGCRSRVGCNNTCTFCIVPSLRGKEKDRRPGDILAEVEALVAEGVIEVTLLGQNVNTYGVGVRRPAGVRASCCAPAARSRAWSGSASPARTRRDFTDDVIDAMAETPNVMPQLHMPLQSGSDAGPARRCAAPTGSERFLGIIDRVRAADARTPRSPPTSSSASPARPRTTSRRPSTSCAQARFASAFTFQYSTAPGHARRRRWPTRCPRPSCRSATSGWSRCRSEISWAENQRRSGRDGRGAGRRGRGPQGRRDPAAVRPRPRQPARALRRARRRRATAARRRGDRRGHLRRAAPPRRRPRSSSVRRTRAGDACRAGPSERHPGPGVMLGLPHRSRRRIDRVLGASSVRPPRASPRWPSPWRQRMGGEIVSTDSMQVYRGMDIGTAKPSQRGAPRDPAPPARRLGCRAAGQCRGVPAATRAVPRRDPRPERGRRRGRRLRALRVGRARRPATSPAATRRCARGGRPSSTEIGPAAAACTPGRRDPGSGRGHPAHQWSAHRAGAGGRRADRRALHRAAAGPTAVSRGGPRRTGPSTRCAR